MKKKETIIVTILLLLTGGSVFAGSLQPMAAPGPTMKTLDQVEPRTPITSVPLTITQSGSYYLTKNLTSLSNGIIVEANDVTIDLCGFTLKGPGCGANNGIAISNERNNIEIRNGTLREFGQTGITGGTNTNYCKIIEIKSLYNKLHGIYLNGSCHIVKNCIVSHCGSAVESHVYGIYSEASAQITGNSISYNDTAANGSYLYCIKACVGSIITDNEIFCNGSTASAVRGIYVYDASIISGNVVRDNGNSTTMTHEAIYAGDNNVIKGNVILRNGSPENLHFGLKINSYNFVDQNVINENGDNLLQTGSNNIITANNVAP